MLIFKIAILFSFYSRIWNEIELIHFQVVLHKVFHIESFKVTWQRLRSYWLDILRLDFRLGHELESLVSLLIRRLAFESVRLVRLQLYDRRAATSSVLPNLP